MRREITFLLGLVAFAVCLSVGSFSFLVTKGWSAPEDLDGMATFLLFIILLVAWISPLSALKGAGKGKERSFRSLVLSLGLIFGTGVLCGATEFMEWGEACYFSLMVTGYALAIFLGALVIRPIMGLGASSLVLYGIAALVMTFPWYGSAFIEALPRESQPWALSYSLQLSPLFIVGGTFLGKDVMVLEGLYIAFPVGQQWPFVYAAPERVAGVAWLWVGAASFLALVRWGVLFLRRGSIEETQSLEGLCD